MCCWSNVLANDWFVIDKCEHLCKSRSFGVFQGGTTSAVILEKQLFSQSGKGYKVISKESHCEKDFPHVENIKNIFVDLSRSGRPSKFTPRSDDVEC